MAKMTKNGPKLLHSKWSSATSGGFLRTSDWTPGHPGMLGSLSFALSAHIGLIIIIHRELFENASSHFVRLNYNSQGQLESPQPGWLNCCSSLLLSLSLSLSLSPRESI